MPRSSRHKSSKHSSRDYSDSEKEKKSKDESSSVRFSKELGSGEKRKLDAGDYIDEYDSSKRRKDKADDGVSGDRWNGGEEDGKGEKKHRESSRKEEREREKKGKEGKGDQLIESDEHHNAKQSAERTELIVADWLQSPESESQPERRIRGDEDKHLEDNVDILDKHLSVSNNTGKDGRKKDEKHKDEKYKDKYREDKNSEDKCQDDKLRDDRSASGHANSKSSEKHLRDGKYDVKVRQKKSMVQDSDIERDCDLDGERDRDRHRERRERDREQDTGRDRERERYRDHDHYRERYRNRDHDHDHDRDYDSQWDQDHDRRYSNRDKNRDLDHDELHDERRSVRYKDSKGRKRSPDDRNEGNDTKSRGAKLQYPDMGNMSSTSGRVEVDADRGRSQSRPSNLDAAMGSNKRRTSPSSISHCGIDDYRHFKQEDSKYRDPMTEQRSKAASSREVTSFSETPERGAKYRSMEKSSRVNEGHSGELPTERSPSSKASPMERSPSTSIERRYMSKSGVKRGLHIEETGWSSASIGGREEDNWPSRDLPPENPLLDGSSQADSVFYNRAGQGNSSLIPQQPGLRAGIGSPSFMGSLEEDNRFNNSGRYKSRDMNVRRGHASACRGAPNWPGPVSNGFIPFQPGPPHSGFQAMMPQFPSPLFGVRPSMEINHSGIPYHIPDAERFNNHLRPMGWQTTMDGSGPAHFHGWDGHNVGFRDEAHMFGGPNWDQNRHPVNGHGWDTSSDVWKGQNGYVDLTSTSQKEDHPLQAPLDDVFDGQERRRSQYENDSNGVQIKGLEMRSDVMSPVKESSRVSLEIPQKASDSNKISSEDDEAHYWQLYLCKLDISAELAGSDLYDQCMSLVNVERSKYLAKDVSMLVNLKHGGRPVQNASIAVLSPSLIPATNASVFQKALDLYKKQRLQMGATPNFNGGMLLFTLASREKGKEQSSDDVVDEAGEPVLISDAEMVDPTMLDSDQHNGEALPTSTSQENMEELVSLQRRESPDHLDSLSPETSELPNTDFGHMNPEVPKLDWSGNRSEETEAEPINSEDVVRDSLRSLDNAAEAVGLVTDVENLNDINKTEGNSCYKEIHAFGDATSACLSVSPKESGDLIPESNESESVILSQMHHSPESTH